MISLPLVHDPPPGGGCGTCTACCDVIGVDTVGKPYYARCPHLDEAGAGDRGGACAIYTDRPHTCRQYRCLWHLGLLGAREDRRPDRCGVIFQLEPQPGGRWLLAAYESTPGALLTDRTQFLIQQILTGKKTRHLSLMPQAQLIPFGAELPVTYPIAEAYPRETEVPRVIPLKPHGQMRIFDGKLRGELLMPKAAADHSDR